MSTQPIGQSFIELAYEHQDQIEVGLSILSEDGPLSPRVDGAFGTTADEVVRQTLILRYTVELVDRGGKNQEELEQLLRIANNEYGLDLSPAAVREAWDDASGTAMLAEIGATIEDPERVATEEERDGATDDEGKAEQDEDVPGEDHCAQFLETKGRYCQVPLQDGRDYCHHHPIENDDKEQNETDTDFSTGLEGLTSAGDRRQDGGAPADSVSSVRDGDSLMDTAEGGSSPVRPETASTFEKKPHNEQSTTEEAENNSETGRGKAAVESEPVVDDEASKFDFAAENQADTEAAEEVTEEEPQPEAGGGESEGEGSNDDDFFIDHDQLHQETVAGEDTSRSTARERDLSSDRFPVYDRITRENTTAQSKLSFDYVREDGIMVDGDHYIGLVEVQPRNWLVLNQEEKNDVFSAFVSFLLQLKYPIQIICYPHEFDVSKHTSNIRKADARAEGPNETPVTRHGRKRHIVWCHNSVDERNIKDRDFYIAVRVRSEQVHSYLQDGNAFGSVLQSLPDALSDRLTFIPGVQESKEVSADEERCIGEVQNRQADIEDTLTRTGVGTRTIDDRDETMDILYRYYNHLESPFSEYNHATYTEMLGEETGSLGGDR